MSNNINITMTSATTEESTPPSSAFQNLISTMKSLGPQRVKTKEFEAEQFDPEKIQRLLERNSSGHPTFANMTRVVVQSNRAALDCQVGKLTTNELTALGEANEIL